MLRGGEMENELRLYKFENTHVRDGVKVRESKVGEPFLNFLKCGKVGKLRGVLS